MVSRVVQAVTQSGFLIFRNIIDVAALDTHLLEQSEYNDRVKIYAQRLAHQWNNIQVNDSKYNGKALALV